MNMNRKDFDTSAIKAGCFKRAAIFSYEKFEISPNMLMMESPLTRGKAQKQATSSRDRDGPRALQAQRVELTLFNDETESIYISRTQPGDPHTTCGRSLRTHRDTVNHLHYLYRFDVCVESDLDISMLH
jgi:hypothetical protein